MWAHPSGEMWARSSGSTVRAACFPLSDRFAEMGGIPVKDDPAGSGHPAPGAPRAGRRGSRLHRSRPHRHYPRPTRPSPPCAQATRWSCRNSTGWPGPSQMPAPWLTSFWTRLYAKSTKGNRCSCSGAAPHEAGAGGFFTIRSFPRHLRTPGCPYHPLSIILAHST